jgi:hypothetical protein
MMQRAHDAVSVADTIQATDGLFVRALDSPVTYEKIWFLNAICHDLIACSMVICYAARNSHAISPQLVTSDSQW